jgi:hypothetical protein
VHQASRLRSRQKFSALASELTESKFSSTISANFLSTRSSNFFDYQRQQPDRISRDQSSPMAISMELFEDSDGS